MSNGYVNISREILENPVVCKNAVTLGVMMWLIKEAAYAEHEAVFGNKVITLKPGQLITGRKAISGQLSVSQTTLERTLKLFEDGHLIGQQTNTRGRLITLLFWDSQNKSGQQIGQQTDSVSDNKRTTNGQQSNNNWT